jgi:hypothetical protein
MTEYLGHKLIKCDYKNDYICSECGIRLENSGDLYFLIIGFISDIMPGATYTRYELSCGETLIKRLLE